MVRRLTVSLVILALMAGIAVSQSTMPQKQSQMAESPQRVKFDPTRDSEKDLKDAIALASKEGKNIMLDVGGEWCSWCHKLDAFFEKNTDAGKLLHENYVVVKINFSKENKNEKFLAKYPEIKGYPHLFVLDGTGKLLHSQDTGLLEDDAHRAHDHDRIVAFLKKWAPVRDI